MKGTEDSALDRSFSPLLLFGRKHPGPHGTDADEATKRGDDETAKDPMFFYSISRRRSVCKIVDDLRDHLYWTTPHGWLLMAHAHPGSRLTFLWNPFTRRRIDLPPDRERFLTRNPVRCALSHEPTDPSCVVLVVNSVDTVLWHCRPGAAEWSEHGYYQAGGLGVHHGRDDVIHAMSLVTAASGKFYASLLGATVLTLEFSPAGPAFTETPIAEQPCHPIPMYRVWSLHLLESRGELFSVSLYHPLMERCDKVAQIVVRRLDLPARAWVEVDAIGDRAFLVDAAHFGASLGAEGAGLKGNCVYYLRRGEKGLYVYDMERGTTAMHDPGPDLPDDATSVILMPAS
ncbi:hypothetical protein VPH35_058805 [Triticum aestivum]